MKTWKREYVTSEVFVCHCNDPAHQIIFQYDVVDDDLSELWAEVHLNQYRPFWWRCWYGLKYAFGFKAAIGKGAFDSVIFVREDIVHLRNLCNKVLRETEE